MQKKNYSSNLLKKCQMKYNSFIKEHRDITMSGTKRYENKSGEYYLQNLAKHLKNSLNINQKTKTSLNINNNNNDANHGDTYYKSNKNIIKVKKKKITDELIPIPTIKQNNKIKNEFEKKNLNNAMDNAKYIRRYQYSNNITQKQIQQYKEMQKNEKIYFNKIKYIQIWWKTIFQIIKIQKYLRGYLYRIKLISILDQRELYIDKVLLLIKSLKKIFLTKFINCLYLYTIDYKKHCFRKWIEITNKKKILTNIINNYSSLKIFKEFYINKKYASRSNKKNNDSKNEKDLENSQGFNNINKNKSLIELHNIKHITNNNKKEQHLSSSSFIFKSRKKVLNIGIELSCSSQILRRPKNENIYEFNQTNYNKKSKKLINNINLFGHFKSDYKRNKTNNKKIKKIKNDSIKTNLKEQYQKEKSFNDLKIKINDKNKDNKDNSSNKNVPIFKTNTNNNKQVFRKSNNINNYNKNIRLSTNSQYNIKSKKNLHKQKMNKNTTSNINNYSNNILKKKTKHKKIKVYENKLKDYKINLENTEKEILTSLNKENNNNNLEKLQPYTESIFDESQFSVLLDTSTLNNIKNAINYKANNENEIGNNKNIRSNSCIDVHSLICQESIDINNENKSNLKKYFIIWTKKAINKLLLNKICIVKNIFLGGKIITRIIVAKIYKELIKRLKMYFTFVNLRNFLKNITIKIFIKETGVLANKYILLKYFNSYKDYINKKIIIQNIIQNQNNLKKKHKQFIRRNRNQLKNDCNLNKNQFMTDIPINNYNNNFVNNNINLNNNTNNCYIINNLNYNDNTNKINIGLTCDTDNNKNNINLNSLGIIRSKISDFPKNIYKQKKLKQSLALYKINQNTLINDDFNSINTINNCSIFNYNKNTNMSKINDTNKSIYTYKQNLSKSVIIPNNIKHLKSDFTIQKNQLTMVINIIEHHRKENCYNLFLAGFKKWKNLNNNNINNKTSENIKTQNEKINNFSGGTTDYEELNKNTIFTDGFHTESDSKSENKISTKSAKLPNNQLNSKLSLENTKGIYKKKTIGNPTYKTTNVFKKHNINNTPLILNKKRSITTEINNNNNNNDQELIIEPFETTYKKKPMIYKNINFLTNNNEINNFKYSSPEKYFGFQKVNKIEEMEISFLPLDKKQVNATNNKININNNINSLNYIINNKIEVDNNYNYNEIDKKKVIIEEIEECNECNECEVDNENIILKIKNEFTNNENYLYRTFDDPKIDFDFEMIEDDREDKNYNSMPII